MTFRVVSVFLIMAAASGCAGRTASPATGAGEAERAPRGNRDVISQEELADPGLKAQNLLNAIRTLRPQFLSDRGQQSYKCASPGDCQMDPDAGKVHVSVDNGRILPLQELENIHTATVREVRFLNQAAAMQKFGGAARSGPVIMVSTVK